MQAQDYYTFASHILPSWIWLKVFSYLTMISSRHIIKNVKIKAMSLFISFLPQQTCEKGQWEQARCTSSLPSLPGGNSGAMKYTWECKSDLEPPGAHQRCFYFGRFFFLVCFHRWASSEQKRWCIRIDLLCNCKVPALPSTLTLDCCFHLREASPASKTQFPRIPPNAGLALSFSLVKLRFYKTRQQWGLVFNHSSSLTGGGRKLPEGLPSLLAFTFINTTIVWMTDSIWLSVVLIRLSRGALCVCVSVFVCVCVCVLMRVAVHSPLPAGNWHVRKKILKSGLF